METKLRHFGDRVVNVLTGEIGVVQERYGFSTHPWYINYIVRYLNGSTLVTRQRHLRDPMTGECRQRRKRHG